MKTKIYDLNHVKTRIRHYCAKEDRCQQQVMHKLSDYGIALKSKNYGIVEDLHHTLMHFICQFLRQKYATKNINRISF